MKRTSSLVALVLLAAAVTPALANNTNRRWNRPNRPPPQPQPVLDLHALQGITTACQNAFEGQTNEQACVQTVMRSPQRFDATASIKACEDAFEGDANELACLAIAVNAWQEPSAAIRACESGFDGDANELTCLRTMAQSWLPATAVAACENAFDGDANEQACLNALVGTRYDVVQLVSYCENNFYGDADELACLGRFR